MPSGSSSASECHALPCNIDFSGKAPTDVYFRPTKVVDDHTNEAAEVKNGKGTSVFPQYQAATFRGRGLLAIQNNDDGPSSTQALEGRFLQVGDASSTNPNEEQIIQQVAQFSQMTEWYHDHDLTSVEQKSSRPENSRVQTAMDWIETAEALHAPIPFNN
jgi:hypothetical protein